MKLLALDTSSQTASAALLDGEVLLGEIYSSVRLTHSQTILPMTESLLRATKTAIEEVELFAVTVGPGSFTGLRIGLAAVKGLAFGLGRPCFGVSTLESLAYNLLGIDGLICPVMDARCAQVYTALFCGENGGLERLQPDSAIPIQELCGWLRNAQRPIFLVGDGARLCYNSLCDSLPGLRVAPPHQLFTRAGSAALVASEHLKRESPVSAGELVPVYLRLPQAERELLAKKNQEKG